MASPATTADLPDPRLKPATQVIPGLPSLSGGSVFGQQRQPIPDDTQLQYMKDQSNHPWLRGLGGAALMAIAAAALANGTGTSVGPSALLGGLAGLGGGLINNKVKHESDNQKIDQYVNLAKQSNQAFDQYAQNQGSIDATERHFDQLDNVVKPDGSPGLPSWDTSSIMTREGIDTYRKQRHDLYAQLYSQYAEPQAGNNLTERYSNIGHTHNGIGEPTPSGNVPSPNASSAHDGQLDASYETEHPLQASAQYQKPYEPPNYYNMPPGVPVQYQANIVDAGTKAGLAPSQETQNYAQAAMNQSQVPLNQARVGEIAQHIRTMAAQAGAYQRAGTQQSAALQAWHEAQRNIDLLQGSMPPSVYRILKADPNAITRYSQYIKPGAYTDKIIRDSKGRRVLIPALPDVSPASLKPLGAIPMDPSEVAP